MQTIRFLLREPEKMLMPTLPDGGWIQGNVGMAAHYVMKQPQQIIAYYSGEDFSGNEGESPPLPAAALLICLGKGGYSRIDGIRPGRIREYLYSSPNAVR